MSNANKNKGKSFERVVAKHLSDVFGLPFQRVPNSGAFCSGANAYRVAQLSNEQHMLVDGDIIIPKELASFSFECKWYKDFSWNELMCKGGNSFIDKWIEQVSQTQKKHWIIIFRINRQGEFVCFRDGEIFQPTKNYIHIHREVGAVPSIHTGYKIAPMEGFFENNKTIMLELGSINYATNN